jgi:hypothetical protein
MLRLHLRYGIIACFIISLLSLAAPARYLVAQDEPLMRTFTWRTAGLTINYPAEWQVGSYDEHPLLASTPDALTNANAGQFPGAPALAFLYYPQASDLTPAELLAVIFPGQTGEAWSLGGLSSVRAQFEDEATGQTVLAVAFKSPLLNRPHLLAAVAPTDQWGAFAPLIETMIASVRFLRETALLEFLGAKVSFYYPLEWEQVSNGQVLVAGPAQASNRAILRGDLQDAPPFVRAQLLAPAGIGVDLADPQAALKILESFTGQTLTDVQEFEWAEGLPAAAAALDFEGLTLLLVAVVDGDTALLIGGGAPSEQWAEAQPTILGVLNLTLFNDNPPGDDLDAALLGASTEGRRLGVAQ